MVCAIVTAAGRSRRMGTQKLLLPFAGGTVIGRVVGELLASPVDRVVVVVAEGDSEVRDALSQLEVTFAVNPDPDSDMLGSIRSGLRAVPAVCDVILVALGDQPSISSELVGRVLAEFPTRAPSIAVPVHAGRRGHPVAFHSAFNEELLTRFDDEGLRGLLRAHPECVREVAISDRSALEDIDCPDDYLRELARLSPRHEIG